MSIEFSDTENDIVDQLDLINDDRIDDEDDDEQERNAGMTADDKLLNREYREDCFNTADEDDEDDLVGVFGADDEDNFDDN